MRLRKSEQTNLWIAGMITATRQNPVSRMALALWMESLRRFYPHDSVPYYLQQYSFDYFDMVEDRRAARRA